MTAGEGLSGAQFPHMHEHGEDITHEDWTGAETGMAPREHFTYIDCPKCARAPQAQSSPDLYSGSFRSDRQMWDARPHLRFFGAGETEHESTRNAHMAHMEGVTQSKLSDKFNAPGLGPHESDSALVNPPRR